MDSRMIRIAVCGLVLAGAAASTACGDDGGGGSGGSPSVLGTKQSGDCTTAEEFYQQCLAEGGLPADRCQDTHCTTEGYYATCYAPPPQPTAAEFTCDGIINCAVGQICEVHSPNADGCFSHSCDAMPAACAADPTCACLQAIGFTSCEADGAGNLTVATQF